MAPNWMPQNIQKRLLLYVLQQLSLFSEIDLPNLDVSLGTNSQVTLNDFEIDTDAIQIPGVYLRNGKVKTCQLTLTVTGGVTVEADGLVLTLSLSSTQSTHSTEKSKFSLAQSTMDLANSIIQDSEFQDAEDTHADLPQLDIPTTDSSDSPQPSTLNNMMSKAVEAALSRLELNATNISARVIMDHATFDVEVKEARFSNKDGVRSFEMSDIMVLSVHPAGNPGETGDTVPEQEEVMENDTVTSEHSDEPENPSSDSEDDDDDETHMEMMSSSMLEKPADMTESLVYSKEEASSIYMSAASDVLESRLRESITATRLAFVNSVKVTFSGLTEVQDVRVMVDEIRVAAVPLPLTLLHFFESLSFMSSGHDYSRSSNINSKVRKNAKTTQPDTPKEKQHPWDEVVVNKLIISLVSALKESGEFCKPEEAIILGEAFSIKHFSDDRIYGSLSKLKFEKHGELFGWFDETDQKSDIRFDMNSKTGDFRLLLGREMSLNLDQDTLQRIINLTSLVPQIVESMTKHRPSQPLKRPSQGTVIVQTSLVSISVKLSDKRSLKLKISPISYDSGDAALSLKKIALISVVGDSKTTLLSAMNVSYKAFPGDKQLRTYDNSGHEILLFTRTSLDIDSIESSVGWCELMEVVSEVSALQRALQFVKEEVVFKTRKKARISTNVMLQSRLSVQLIVNIKSISLAATAIPGFGDITASFETISVILHKEGYTQLHTMKAEINRVCAGQMEPFFSVINPDDRSAPIVSLRTRDFKSLSVLLRNCTVDYYTKWLSMLDNDGKKSVSEESSLSELGSSDVVSSEPKMDLKLTLIDASIGLSPGRLSSKANLVIPSGSMDILVAQNTMVKSDLRGCNLVLIDDVENIASYEETKANRGNRGSWSQMAYFNAKGYTTVANLKNLSLNVVVKQPSQMAGETSSSVFIDINADCLELDLCADSSHCLLQLINDLKQPVTINTDLKYKVHKGHEVSVFDDIDEDAFNSAAVDDPESSTTLHPPSEPFNIVESYYDETHHASDDEMADGSDILDRSLNDLQLKDDDVLKKNPYFAPEKAMKVENSVFDTEPRSNNSDSLLLFNENHFDEPFNTAVRRVEKSYPMSLGLTASKVLIRIYDGYDWKHTRKAISHAVKRLEQKAKEQKEQLRLEKQQSRESQQQRPTSVQVSLPHDRIIGETLFDSIHVSLPVSSDPSVLTAKINKEIHNKEDEFGIDVGKSNPKKLKLRRSKTHKVLVELDNTYVDFNLFSNKDPVSSTSLFGDLESELVSELLVRVKDFEVTDNVPTSTWKKFVTYMKDEDRESGSSMLTLSMKTVRPVSTLAATELVMDAHVLPLRLHVDQDTLEVLTRFGEFKDARFALVDELEELAYIQKFTINAIHIKLDYKPKKVDYAGLRSGHTTEFMNFFILDEADMVLKSVTLHGISGFPRLGAALNGLWMPDIKSTQLSGVLTGLAPVRSIAKIGSGFKDLVAVPVKEYKKDGRIYRSFSKGVTQFTKTTTNEMLKLGVKLAAGTQAILEHTEEALGGTGAAARVGAPVRDDGYDSEDELDEEAIDDDDDEYDATLRGGYGGANSHLIGRSALTSTTMLHRSVYQPTLESIADINNQASWMPPHRSGRKMSEASAELHAVIEEDESEEGPKMVSLYADQPTSIKEGFLLAYDSLGRNLLVAKDAILNAGAEINESGSMHDTTLAVMKATPVVLLRPVIGATEAASRALLGINNQLDPSQRRYTEDKYKQHK